MKVFVLPEDDNLIRQIINCNRRLSNTTNARGIHAVVAIIAVTMVFHKRVSNLPLAAIATER